MISALLIAHIPDISIYGLNIRDREVRKSITRFVLIELGQVLRHILIMSLRQLLQALDVTLQKRARKDWLRLCFAMCMLLFAVESMQIDVYLQQPRRAASVCERMESAAISTLIQAFRESSGGIDPLCIDWNRAASSKLVDGDEDIVRSMQHLKILTENYGKYTALVYKVILKNFTAGFMNTRREIDFDIWNTDCFTGKLVSRLLL